MADPLIGQQHSELPCNHGVELAFTVLPLTETVGELAHAYRLGRGSEEIQQYPESLSGSSAQRLFEYLASTHEEAAQQVRDISFADHARQQRSEPAESRTAEAQIADTTS